MQFKILTHKEEISEAEWAGFVYNHPDGNIFQTPDIFNVYKATRNYQPLAVACVDKATSEFLGILVAVVQKEYTGIIGKFTSRSIIVGGPLCKNNNPLIADAILAAYNRIARSKAIYSQVRCMHDTSSYSPVFKKQHYYFEEHLNILIDLCKSEEQLWKEFTSKRRQKINSAERTGVVVNEVTKQQELTESYEILRQVYKRVKLPFPDVSLFNAACNQLMPQNKMKVYGAYSENKLIGIRMVLLYKKYVFDWYAGSYLEETKKRPNDILPWEIFRQTKNLGFETFDFGGAGKPDQPYPVRDYKKQFGGTFVNFGRYEIIHHPLIYKFAKMGFKLWQKIR